MVLQTHLCFSSDQWIAKCADNSSSDAGRLRSEVSDGAISSAAHQPPALPRWCASGELCHQTWRWGFTPSKSSLLGALSNIVLLTIPKWLWNTNLDTFQPPHSWRGVLHPGPPTPCLSSLWSCRLMRDLFLTPPKVYLAFPANLYFVPPCWGLGVWTKVWGRVVLSTATRSLLLGVWREGIVGCFLDSSACLDQ